MPRRLIDPSFTSSLRERYFSSSSREERRKVIQRGVKESGYSIGALYRVLKLSVRKKKPNTASLTRAKTIDQYAKIVWDHQQEHSKGTRKLKTAPVYRYLVSIGTIPKEIRYHHIAASIRRQQFKRKAIPLFHPFEREDPLSAIQVDFTRSAYFETVKKGEKESVRLSYSKGANGAESRVWIGVAIDDASRVTYGRYYITSGESAKLAQHFMIRTFRPKLSKSGSPLPLLQGVPKQIYTDRGSGFRNIQTANGLRRMGIVHAIGSNERDSEGKQLQSSNKQGRGKVERMIQVIKGDFETTFLLKYGVKQEFTLKELNDEFRRWLVVWNSTEHPTREAVNKWQVFETVLSSVEYPDENAAELFYTSSYKTVHRGQVNVDTGIWCKAPHAVSHGDKIEIISSSGRFYTIIDGKRVELEVISDRQGKVKKSQKIEKPVEKVTDHLEGLTLRSRLSAEIERISKHAYHLGTFAESIGSELNVFLGSPRSIREIYTFASALITRHEERSEFTISESGELVSIRETE